LVIISYPNFNYVGIFNGETMRKWLIEETGEIRVPIQGEYFLSYTTDGILLINWQISDFVKFYSSRAMQPAWPILRITEITEEI
jgi:hypothetical protein